MCGDFHRKYTVCRPPGCVPRGCLRGLRRRTLLSQSGLSALPAPQSMTLAQLSKEYEASAVLLRKRLRLLRQKLSQETDEEEIWHLKRRIAELTPMLTQMNELAELTARYYERGYYRNEKYTL